MKALINWLRPRDYNGALLVGPFERWRPLKLLWYICILLS